MFYSIAVSMPLNSYFFPKRGILALVGITKSIERFISNIKYIIEIVIIECKNKE